MSEARPAKANTLAKATTEGTEVDGEDTENQGQTGQTDLVTQRFALSSRRPFSAPSPLFLGVLCGCDDRGYSR